MLIFLIFFHDYHSVVAQLQNKFYRQISAFVQTTTFFQANTLVAIKNKAIITLTPFKTSFRTGIWANKASTSPNTGVCTHLKVTVLRAGSSYKRGRLL